MNVRSSRSEVTSPPGLDLEALARYLEPLVGSLHEALRGEVIAGGKSNLTYSVSDGERRFVVRRPPLAHVLPTAHDMRREYRVLAALRETSIPVPPIITYCDDPALIGAPFYVMEWVDGHVIRDELPPEFTPTAETHAAMSAALVDTLVKLHAVEPEAVGLNGFGHPEGFLARQVRRWWMQWEASATRPLPSIEELHVRLEETLPVQSAPGIVHGDYRLDNVMYAPSDPAAIVAVLDWEMCTIGDPLCDLGLLLVYWAEDADEPAAQRLQRRAPTTAPGFFSRRGIIERYAGQSNRDLSALDWYVALGAYKLAIIAEGIHARFLMGMTVGEGFERMGEIVPLLVEDALHKLGRTTASER